MPAERIQYGWHLKRGTDELNKAIDAANAAEVLSTTADTKATQALSNSVNTQEQLDTIVIEGDSSVEAAQARVPLYATAYPTLKARLDAEYNGLTADLAENTQNIALKANKKGLASFSALSVALETNFASAGVQVLGDSTGDASNEWVYKLATWLKDKYPAWNVVYRLWSDTLQGYSDPIVLNTALSGVTSIGDGTNTRIYPSSHQINGDLDVFVKMSLPDWTPAAVTTPISRFGGVAAEKAWYLSVMTDGRLRFIWTPDGSTLKSHVSTQSVPFVDGATGFVRVTFDADNGSGGCTAKFYTSTDGFTWTQLGTDVTLLEVATINNASYLELGGRTQNGEILPSGGRIYEVHVKDGINGFNIVPVMPDLWNDRGTGVSHSIQGAPTLTIVNGSHPGSNLAYLGETTRIKKLTPDYGQKVVLISNSHNEGQSINAPYRNEYSDLVDKTRDRLPFVPIIAIAQNPEKTTVLNYKRHAVRRSNIYEVAKTKNLEVADVYSVFPLDNLDPYMLDSVHPNSAGQDLWKDAIISLWVN